MVGLSKFAFNSDFHVGVTLPNTSISPLSLWERARVRGYFADTIKNLKRSLSTISRA
ncbi:hypothetical protein PS925_03598 [Pseudomonas fluorescens]|uniref:Uncharacterized protein n=1 Tax=Pseudomonas fluorescens TaxID=294 RepID=A0A5E7ULP6_PSEFL|nr:hypothetical protein PS925_03598 [Pseudomonas fluorescens]